MSEEDHIIELIAGRAAAVAAADAEGVVASLAQDVVTFDMIGGLRKTGRAGALDATRDWLALYDGSPQWTDRDVTVVAGGGVAFTHALSRVTGRRKDGVDVDMWFRTTLGLRRADGVWRIVHEHLSEPFDIHSGKARLDLVP